MKKSQEMAARCLEHCLEAEAEYKHSGKEFGLAGMVGLG